ncbi:PREDICTED: alpha-(1,3)-fucosyltransferase C-like [Atta colombica]|uniref:alpha-(1,3)-fucosyltransferase C-like n=1 Tax=Atta colombica TaxID=520822 RepID=UPI00084C4CBE|nr:PREDICTED: alpha-(1,3)-fucosyltransferase C-like [Atta colombica]XP_018055296.1 PREDICTED: alpha-(1,3)-fucosyltransferase C-like [Atta colombica]
MRTAYLHKNIVKTMKKKSYLFIGLIVVMILITCLYYSVTYDDFQIQNIFRKMIREEDYFANEIDRAKIYRKKGIKTILLWKTLFGNKNFYFGQKEDFFRDCSFDKCKIFNDRNYMNVEDYDAILFHGNEMNDYEVPQKRKTTQFYVYVNLESPANRKVHPKYQRNFFNLTMTYRLDSDILWTYIIVEDIKNGEFVAPLKDVDWSAFQNHTNARDAKEVSSAILDTIRNKSKSVSWLVSNCYAKSGRLEYVKELSKHIDVDVYGRCGKFNCYNKDCFKDVIEANYFFYLSFENSFCDDYVTEKLVNPFRHNVVPVVYGSANYSRFAPPNSYVNALDFESPKELAAYLKYLSLDLQRYQSFLQWKKYYRVRGGTERAVCTLCEVLHKQKKPKLYSDLSDWYAKDKCIIQTFLENGTDKYATKRMLMKYEQKQGPNYKIKTWKH